MAHDRRGRRSDSDGSGGPARLSLLLVALLLGVTDARAGELIELTVEHSDGRYLLSAHLMVDAPPEAVRRRLTDYANLSALSPSIIRCEGQDTDQGLCPALLPHASARRGRA
ncbi:MAG: hypothetical protein PVH47_01765 [Thiohalocapsa sp.]